MPRWQQTLAGSITAVALTPLGDYLAAADAAGNLSLFTRKGKLVWRTQSPRPLHFLAFVPEKPLLAGSADYGLVACFDVKGNMLWRDGLVAHVGSLAVNGDGSRIVLACYTDGLTRYGVQNSKPERQPLPDACRLAALSYDGRCSLTAGLLSTVTLRDVQTRVMGEQQLEAPATVLALSALADRALIGTATGLVQSFRWR
jgi:WD40 repeat protein